MRDWITTTIGEFIDFNPSEKFIVLRNNKLSDAKFIYYLARSPYFREKAISCMEGTSGRKRVNETALKHLNIKVPPLKTQQKIAKILSDIDDKIEVLHQINDNLAELIPNKKTLFRVFLFILLISVHSLT